MSLKGTSSATNLLRGSINSLKTLTLSAYAIAVKNGFVGTEEEWLESLKMSYAELEDAVAKYLEENPVATDATLSKVAQAADAKATGDAIKELEAEAKANSDAFNEHAEDKNNPHGVTAEQVGARPNTWTPTAEDVGARPNTWLPSPDDIGAINAASTSLTNMSVKEWAQSLKSSAWAFTDTTTLDMPPEVSSSLNYAIVTANAVAGGGWIELRVNYILTGCVAKCFYNYGWGDWAWENPPMTIGTEYRTTEQYNGKAVYTKALSFVASYPSASAGFSGATELIRASIRVDNMMLPHHGTNGEMIRWAQTSNAGISVFFVSEAYATGTIYAQVWYTKD